MKALIKIVLCLCASMLFTACEQDTVLSPKASMTVNQSTFVLNEAMVIHFTGVADQVAIYTGDNEHDYELRKQGNTGFVVNKGMFSYSYSAPGTYKVVCIASTYDDLAIELQRDTCSYMVTVVDDDTEIERLSCPQVLYDEVFAERLPNDEWLMRLPSQVMYNNKPQKIPLSQRLKLYIASDSTKVTINGKEFEERSKYDLSQPVDILLKSNEGTERSYKLYTMYYPEFKTFSLAGVEGTLVRDVFDYTSFQMNVVLPEGTDISQLKPEFETIDDSSTEVFIGNVKQESGVSSVDFGNEVAYRLVSTISGKQAESTVSIKISYQ